MFEFNNNHLFTGYVKQLLHEFNLPKAKVLKYGMLIFKGGYYVDKNFLYKATITAIYGTDFTSKDATYEETDTSGEVVKKPYLFKITEYIYGMDYLNVTKNLEMNSSIYTPYTHRYLGDYLRFYRDYKNIDLMSMYNCFASEVGKNINIIGNGDLFKFDSYDENYVIYLVPVKFYKEYTIAIDCDSSIEMVACFYDNGRVVLQNSTGSPYFYTNTYMKRSGSCFNKPFKYDKLLSILNSNSIDADKAYSQEKNLTLLIKVPVNNKSSLVVLEGDFTKTANLGLNVSGFSWEELNYKLDLKLDWFKKDSTGHFVKVFNNDSSYHKAGSSTSVSYIEPGYTYYDAEDTGLENPIVVTLNDVFYSFLDSHLKVNYFVNNTERDIKYYLDSSFLSKAPQRILRNNIFVDESTGMSYLWEGDDEGEYVPMTNMETNPNSVYSRTYNSRLQLLFVNDGIQHPFADKLVGYLLENVISSDDSITDNIRRLQKTFYYRKNPKSKPDYNPKTDRIEEIGYKVFPKHTGVWSQDLRDMAYDLMNVKDGLLNNTFDTIGFIDKDIERVLGDDLSYDKTGHVISGGVR